MNKNEILEIINFAKSNTELNAIFEERVQYFSFLNEPTQTSLVVFDHTDNDKIAQNESLLDFRVIVGIDKNPITVKEYLEKIKSVFDKNDLIIGNTKYYQIDCMNDFFIVNNGKGHEGVISFIFKK